MKKIIQRHHEIAAQRFNEHLENGESVAQRRHKIDPYEELLKKRLFQNKPLRVLDMQDLEEIQSWQIHRFVETFKRIVTVQEIEKVYQLFYTGTMAFVENGYMTANCYNKGHLIAQDKLTEAMHLVNHDYTFLKEFQDTAQTDALIYLRKEFLDPEATMVPKVDNQTFRRFPFRGD